MIKFKETYKNSYSNLLDNEEKHTECKMKFQNNGKTVIFHSKYSLFITKNSPHQNKKSNIELKELEWEL